MRLVLGAHGVAEGVIPAALVLERLALRVAGASIKAQSAGVTLAANAAAVRAASWPC
jgi:hypothetical protein